MGNDSLTAVVLKNVERILAEHDISRADLARRMGVAPPHVSRMLNEATAMNLETVDRISKALGIGASELVRTGTSRFAKPPAIMPITFEDALERVAATIRGAEEDHERLNELEARVSKLERGQ